MWTFFFRQIIPSWVIIRTEIKMTSSLRLSEKFDWSMTVEELLDNITQLVIFYFLNIGLMRFLPLLDFVVAGGIHVSQTHLVSRDIRVCLIWLLRF